MSTTDDRAALVARQGVGARYDAAEAPAADLLLARRGTAYFARILNGLPDEDLMQIRRAQVVADVGYHAREMAEALAALRTGQSGAGPGRVTGAASLPARALRGLFQHSAIHLDVEWRDLPGPMWEMEGPQTGLRAMETPFIRARYVWHAAMRIGGRDGDLPPILR